MFSLLAIFLFCRTELMYVNKATPFEVYQISELPATPLEYSALFYFGFCNYWLFGEENSF